MKRIIGIKRQEESTLRLGGIGDNWHMTWARDDKQYFALCDGPGWSDIEGYSGKNYNTRVYANHGNPPNVRFEHLPGYPDLLTEDAPNVNRYYGFGIISVDGKIYHFLSTPDQVFSQPNARFVGAKLIVSPDNGRTWKNQDGSQLCWEPWKDRSSQNMMFFKEPGEAFSLMTVLQMGKDYEYNKDGYVYMYSPNGNSEGSMNQLVLARVPKERITDRSAYEFFVEHNSEGKARWAKDINDMGIVHTFPSGWVNDKAHPYAWHPSVVYNAALGVYMMVNWGMGCAPDGWWFGKPSYLGFWIAEHPWGPWRQIHEDTEWTPANDSIARAYQPQIAPKWISKDGLEFWLVWTDFQNPDGDRMPYYSFNTQKVNVLTE
jgi:hypothetical protein